MAARSRATTLHVCTPQAIPAVTAAAVPAGRTAVRAATTAAASGAIGAAAADRAAGVTDVVRRALPMAPARRRLRPAPVAVYAPMRRRATLSVERGVGGVRVLGRVAHGGHERRAVMRGPVVVPAVILAAANPRRRAAAAIRSSTAAAAITVAVAARAGRRRARPVRRPRVRARRPRAAVPARVRPVRRDVWPEPAAECRASIRREAVALCAVERPIPRAAGTAARRARAIAPARRRARWRR